MKKYGKFHLAYGVMALIVFIFVVTPAWAGDVTLIGEVNDSYQLLSNGQIYEIADTPKGNEMAENHINAKVKVTGSVEEKNDMKTITVTNFTVLNE